MTVFHYGFSLYVRLKLSWAPAVCAALLSNSTNKTDEDLGLCGVLHSGACVEGERGARELVN